MIDEAQLLTSLQDCIPSLLRIIVGVGVAFLLGLAFGFLRYFLPEKLRRNPVFNFLIEVPRYPPPIAWIPFVIIVAGIGEFSAGIIVVIGAFFPIFTSTYIGMRNIPRAVIWTAHSLELSKFRFFTEILFKGALPQILSGLRIGLGMGWMSVIAAEMIGAQSGLGYSIQMYRMNMQYEAMVLDMFLIGLIGYGLTLVMNFLERRVLAWADVVKE